METSVAQRRMPPAPRVAAKRTKVARKHPTKTLYLLNIGDYAPELTSITYPHIEYYADRIGADIFTIDDRKFPEWDMDYEKLQIYEIARKRRDDWAIYIDSDALVHPELPDLTELIPRDTVAHNGSDFAPIRWRYDDYFRRDGRHIGSCNWFAVASSWCLDLWRPLDDLTFAQAVENITLTADEKRSGVLTREHLVSDYALSRNIARFGLKFMTLGQLWESLHMRPEFFFHLYTVPVEEKIRQINEALDRWNL